MKVLGICGTNTKKGKTPAQWFLDKALDGARTLGAETESIRLINFDIKSCASCHMCMCGHECPLFKDPTDDGKKVFDMLFAADALIFSSSVYSYQQPAVVVNFIQRARYFHEVERGRLMGLKSIRMKGNPFSGKPVGNLAVSATIGHEEALAGLMHNLRGLGATPVACAGIALMDPVIKDMYNSIPDARIRDIYCKEMSGYEENECAAEMAASVGKWVVRTFQSEIFQRIKYHIKL